MYMLHGNLNLTYDINPKNTIGASLAMDGDWTDIRDETVTDYLRDGILTQSSLVSSRTGNPVVKPGIGYRRRAVLQPENRRTGQQP